MVKLKVSQVGNSLGVLLPKEALNRLSVQKGDSLFLVESPEGYVLTAFDPDVSEQLDAAEQVMKRYKNTLRKLAQ